jgi:hypothetical protein
MIGKGALWILYMTANYELIPAEAGKNYSIVSNFSLRPTLTSDLRASGWV